MAMFNSYFDITRGRIYIYIYIYNDYDMLLYLFRRNINDINISKGLSPGKYTISMAIVQFAKCNSLPGRLNT